MGAVTRIRPVPELAMHPLALLFPEMAEDAFAKFCADIRDNGLQEPIVLYQGRIIDGRHRYRAMRFLDPQFHPSTAPRCFKNYDGDDPLQEVMSRNLFRRHLTDNQRAILMAKARKEAGLTIEQASKLGNVSANRISKAVRIVREQPRLAQKILTGAVRTVTPQRAQLATDLDAEVYKRFCKVCAGRDIAPSRAVRLLVERVAAGSIQL